jgi:hypothetical protein
MAALLRWAFPPTPELDGSTEYDPVLFVVTDRRGRVGF